MKVTVNVDVHPLARVEGHGNIRIRIRDGQVEEARWEVVETPRFFEVMLKGKHYTTAGILSARICGICSIGHCLASVRATEDAFGVVVPEAAAKLRLLAKHGETLQSHVLHLFFLAAPDFLGLDSVIPLLRTRPKVPLLAARLKGLANRLCDLVAGRTTHPVSLQVGGVAVMPEKKKLAGLRQELVAAVRDLEATEELFRTFEIPHFIRETEFVSLKGTSSYPWIGGRLVSSDGVERREREYRAMTGEYVVDSSTSKLCKLSRESMAVGSLARLNNNFALLRPEAKAVAERFGLCPVNHNPFMNNVAQLVECFHVAYESLEIMDEILDRPAETPIMAEVEPREGLGVGAVEVPRGTLYHEHEYDREGRIVRANCVIPTTQNHKNIQDDIAALAREYGAAGVDDAKMELLASMLVRAYDPCISCSVH
jgi:coenzyme F420-reducing hydrogenase alpha subunit